MGEAKLRPSEWNATTTELQPSTVTITIEVPVYRDLSLRLAKMYLIEQIGKQVKDGRVLESLKAAGFK